MGVVDSSKLWELGGLGSGGSEESLGPNEEGTSIGRHEVEEGEDRPPRLVLEGELPGVTGTS